LLQPIVADFQKRRELVTDEIVKEFMSVRPMGKIAEKAAADAAVAAGGAPN